MRDGRITHRIALYFWVILLATVAFLPADQATGLSAIPQIPFRIVNTYPHDSSAFTEGLVWQDGQLYESTGLAGSSSLRQVDLASGRVVRMIAIPNLFAEGLASWRGLLYQLTYQDHQVLVWRNSCLCRIASAYLAGQGWGLTTDGNRLLASNGSNTLQWLDPTTFRPVGELRVNAATSPVDSLNELEWTPDGLFANLWPTDTAVRIDLQTGRVTGQLDLSRLGDSTDRNNQDNVPNGIAYDPANHHLLVTGKRWRHLYELALSAA
jgi:glutaminyl-peptide cyclotransferase